MFSVRQKREISSAIQKILRDTGHPELPTGEIQFTLHVYGAESWNWADIKNNGAVTSPSLNPWNELQDSAQPAPHPDTVRLEALIAAAKKVAAYDWRTSGYSDLSVLR